MTGFACGHPKTEANIYWSKQAGGTYAKCRVCMLERNKARQRRKREEAAAMRPPRPTEEQRFWAKVIRTPGCWLWDAATDRRGRGVFSMQLGRRREDFFTVQAHVWSYESVHGPIPAGMHVHHRCEEPLCVRPDHLELLTWEEHQTAHGHGIGNRCAKGHERYRQPCGRWRCPVCKR